MSALKKFKLLIVITVSWDGSDETAVAFGYGDYVQTKYHEIAQIEAINEKEARKISRKICKEKRIPCLFSGVGHTVVLEEEKSCQQ